MIRRAAPDEAEFIIRTGAAVYAPLGDYGRILPGWIVHPGVLTFVEADDQVAGTPRAFILLGFYNGWVEAQGMVSDELIADLLAIAVAPAHQGSGIGTRLLRYAIDLVEQAAVRSPVAEMRLTVADTNLGAQRLFARHGFEVIDAHHGAYDGGQRAIRMRRKITRSASGPGPSTPASA
jgi:ribosomal protein S18 acetylase RimI-like enzyme